MPTQAALCSTNSDPGKPPDHAYPTRFHGRPVKAWPRPHSVALQATANRQSRASGASRKRALPAAVTSNAPAGTRRAALSGEPSPIGDALAAICCGRQPAHPQPLDASRIGVEHLKLDPVGMSDDLAALRHAPRQRENQPAQRIDRLLVAGRTQAGAMLLLDRIDRDARIGDDAAVGPLDQDRRRIDIVLVLDLADDLLDD